MIRSHSVSGRMRRPSKNEGLPVFRRMSAKNARSSAVGGSGGGLRQRRRGAAACAAGATDWMMVIVAAKGRPNKERRVMRLISGGLLSRRREITLLRPQIRPPLLRQRFDRGTSIVRHLVGPVVRVHRRVGPAKCLGNDETPAAIVDELGSATNLHGGG